MILKLDDKFKRIKISEVTQPPQGLNVAYKDRWWVVTEDEEILLYKGHHPQCNASKEIAERLCPKGCTVRQLDVVFFKIRTNDFEINQAS